MECFDSIYLGVNICDTDKDRIIHLAKKVNPEINVYQMIPDTNSFNLIATKSRGTIIYIINLRSLL